MTMQSLEKEATEVKAKVKGRRPKSVAPPTRKEHSDIVRAALVNLPTDLMSGGFASCLPPLGVVKLVTAPVYDPKTKGWIGHVEEPLGVFLQRVSVENNFSQRPPFEHATDPIYKRLIRDFISGAAMPESKVAALRKAQGLKAESLDVPDIYYSIIDGLQRQYCYGLALLLVWHREALVKDRLVTQESWEYFRGPIEEAGNVKVATEALLGRTMRYEIFYNIDLEGLLHYMVTFNTAQRRMSLDVQLEIMRGPLIQELENVGIPIWRDIQGGPGMKQPRDKFAAAELVLATQAFITANPQVAAAAEAERFLDNNERYLDDVGDIGDVQRTLRRITMELHPEITRVYADKAFERSILTGNVTFLHGLAAACGYMRNRVNMKALDGALDKLLVELRKGSDDPLRLAAYLKALKTIKSSRGKAMRRLVYDTFLRFFNGTTLRLEWEDTAQQITG